MKSLMARDGAARFRTRRRQVAMEQLARGEDGRPQAPRLEAAPHASDADRHRGVDGHLVVGEDLAEPLFLRLRVAEDLDATAGPGVLGDLRAHVREIRGMESLHRAELEVETAFPAARRQRLGLNRARRLDSALEPLEQIRLTRRAARLAALRAEDVVQDPRRALVDRLGVADDEQAALTQVVGDQRVAVPGVRPEHLALVDEQQIQLLHLGVRDGALRRRPEAADRVDRVAEELEPDGMLALVREEVEDVSTGRELASLLDEGDGPKTDAGQRLRQLAGIVIRSTAERRQRAHERLHGRHGLKDGLNGSHDEAGLGRPTPELIEHREPLRVGVPLGLRVVEKERLPRRKREHRRPGERLELLEQLVGFVLIRGQDEHRPTVGALAGALEGRQKESKGRSTQSTEPKGGLARETPAGGGELLASEVVLSELRLLERHQKCSPHDSSGPRSDFRVSRAASCSASFFERPFPDLQRSLPRIATTSKLL